MNKKLKPMNDIEIVRAFALAPRKEQLKLQASLKNSMDLASKTMGAMYANIRCAEFINKFVNTPSGDALSALVQVIEQEGPSRGLGRIMMPTNPTLGR